MDYPALLTEYIKFVNYRINFEKEGKLDLTDVVFIFPTTLLPLSEFIINNQDKYIPPDDYPTANYISTIITATSSNPQKTYTPIVSLPNSYNDAEIYLKKLFDIQRSPNDFGGISAFKYVVSELVDNIYQHSRFTRALIVGQRFDYKGFVDLVFYDNGITVPQTFKEKGLNYEASFAIREALNGVSTKDDNRGFGLRTCLNLFKKGLKAEFFIVSGNGAVHCDKKGDNLYRLVDTARLNGTLISVRIPKDAPEVNIYDYVE